MIENTKGNLKEVRINEENNTMLLLYSNKYEISYDTCLNSILKRWFTECNKLEKEGMDNGI